MGHSVWHDKLFHLRVDEQRSITTWKKEKLGISVWDDLSTNIMLMSGNDLICFFLSLVIRNEGSTIKYDRHLDICCAN